MERREVIGANVRRFRARSGMTQAQVANRAGLSTVAYRNVEKGLSEPRLNNLKKISEALGLTRVGDLFEETWSPTHVRFRSRKKLKRREDVLVDVGEWLKDYAWLEEQLDATAQPPAWLYDVAVDVDGDARMAAQSVRDHLRPPLSSADEPIHDIAGLLDSIGIKVRATGIETEGFFGLSVGPEDKGPAIVVNAWRGKIPVERWIFSAAHELGHLVLHLNPETYDVSNTKEEDKTQEREANIFASYLLMPHSRFVSEWNDAKGKSLFERVLKVKRIFRVSYQTVLARLDEHSDKSYSELIGRFQIEHKHKHGRTLKGHEEPVPIPYDNEPSGLKDEPARLNDIDFSDDRFAALVRKAFESELVTMSAAADMLDKSLIEMRELATDWFTDVDLEDE